MPEGRLRDHAVRVKVILVRQTVHVWKECRRRLIHRFHRNCSGSSGGGGRRIRRRGCCIIISSFLRLRGVLQFFSLRGTHGEGRVREEREREEGKSGDRNQVRSSQRNSSREPLSSLASSLACESACILDRRAICSQSARIALLADDLLARDLLLPQPLLLVSRSTAPLASPLNPSILRLLDPRHGFG